MNEPKGGPADGRDTERKIGEALDKYRRGEHLTEYEWMVVQYERGGGCHACGMRVAVTAGMGKKDR